MIQPLHINNKKNLIGPLSSLFHFSPLLFFPSFSSSSVHKYYFSSTVLLMLQAPNIRSVAKELGLRQFFTIATGDNATGNNATGDNATKY